MAEEGKKFSFSFSKSIKKPALKNVPPPEEKKIDYIECVDEKSIKIVGGEEKKDEPLIIPMLGSKTWHDRIINKVDADIFEIKVHPEIKDEPLKNIQVKQEKIDDVPNGDVSKELVQPMEFSEIKKEPNSNPLTLDEQAAREIIADLNSDDQKIKEQNVLSLPLPNDDLKGKEESSLEDYENIPIDAFGLAMLRGMGWQPGKGIGKNEKVVPPSIPELRPKGMGLGADKLVAQKLKGNSTKENEQLKLLKGSCVKIIAGKYSGNYGKVEGFDEDAARIIIKLALGNEVISVNEIWVQAVTTSEYLQNAKVLMHSERSRKKSRKKYSDDDSSMDEKERRKRNSSNSSDDNHKRKKSKKKKHQSLDDNSTEEKSRRKRNSSDSSDDNYKQKKLKKKKHQSSDDNNTDEKSRKRRDSSSNSDHDYKEKRSKKLKKHKSRDNSSERLSRKNKKKDKEHEKIKYKKSDKSESSRKSSKNHRRSRSRSYSPRNRRSRSPKR